ncbi:MAG: GNAT family N-acetyltransferase [Alphaproteobacteria bacterium]|nr:MAG: GNAT family N-acetyltransferase [Alphaproteobacteria bacterium]
MYYVLVVPPAFHHLYQRQIEEMFRQRYRVFVEILGWELPDVDHKRRLEIDQFDRADTVYLIVMKQGNVVSASRMIPTTTPNMMSEVFPDLCQNGVPRDAGTWEWSRAHVNPDAPYQERSLLIDYIFLSGYEFAYYAGISALSAQINAAEIDRGLDRGLVVDLLGPPTHHKDGSELLALQHHITAKSSQMSDEKPT